MTSSSSQKKNQDLPRLSVIHPTTKKHLQLFTGFTGVSQVHLSNLCRWDGPEIGIELGCDQGIETRLSEGVWGTVVEKWEVVFYWKSIWTELQ